MNVRFSAATSSHVEDEVERIISTMPAPKSTDGEGLMRGYVEALKGMPVEAIKRAVDGFLNGQFSPEFSPRWCPMPPELAIMVRRCMAGAENAEGGAEYWYRLPRSRLLRQRVTRETVRQLVDNGTFQRGVIWIPGAHGRPGDRPDIGTLFAPDPRWKPAKLVDKRTQAEREADDAAEERDAPVLSAEAQGTLNKFRRAVAGEAA